MDRVGLTRRTRAGEVSIERYVRIAAGYLVVIDAILGWFVIPDFMGLFAMTDAGMIRAGIKDPCALGLVFANMPSNERRASHCPAGQPASK
jgi:hypothetical protein